MTGVSALSRILFLASLATMLVGGVLGVAWVVVIAWLLLWCASVIQDRSVRRV